MSDPSSLNIRPWQYRDLEKMANVSTQIRSGLETTQYGTRLDFRDQLQYVKQWYGPLWCLQLFPNPLQHFFSAYVAEKDSQLSGFIQVSPFNYTHSTWRVERIASWTGPSTTVSSDQDAEKEINQPVLSTIPPSKQVVSAGKYASPADEVKTETAHQELSDYGLNGGGESSSSPSCPESRSESRSELRNKLSEVAEPLATDVASQLLRYCLDTLWEARTWMVEVGISEDAEMALYRYHGFQPLAHVTYWAIAPALIKSLASLPTTSLNLRPVSNADAGLLHQLDTVSMPPLVRQVFDRHVADFKTSLPEASLAGLQQLMEPQETVSSYVFEPQRKAAIGYFCLRLCQDGSQPHTAELTVHPAYTWLYRELLTQMAQIAQKYPDQSLQLTSSDYQAERESYLEKIGATRTQHTLLMSRSVWHKVRETKQVTISRPYLSFNVSRWGTWWLASKENRPGIGF
ncbi:MAG: GNAT family N-acetyltransferase [Merismopedia sp. SIO2A8]|nr:GNAT family N-acetyltransferase [Merismopedia sp. SIO2A8]